MSMRCDKQDCDGRCEYSAPFIYRCSLCGQQKDLTEQYNAVWSIISPAELEWIPDGWNLIQEYWIHESAHVLMGNAGNHYYILRTFLLGDRACVSVDFEGNHAQFIRHVLSVMQHRHVVPTFKEFRYDKETRIGTESEKQGVMPNV